MTWSVVDVPPDILATLKGDTSHLLIDLRAKDGFRLELGTNALVANGPAELEERTRYELNYTTLVSSKCTRGYVLYFDIISSYQCGWYSARTSCCNIHLYGKRSTEQFF